MLTRDRSASIQEPTSRSYSAGVPIRAHVIVSAVNLPRARPSHGRIHPPPPGAEHLACQLPKPGPSGRPSAFVPEHGTSRPAPYSLGGQARDGCLDLLNPVHIPSFGRMCLMRVTGQPAAADHTARQCEYPKLSTISRASGAITPQSLLTSKQPAHAGRAL